jgi:hypothetical protein
MLTRRAGDGAAATSSATRRARAPVARHAFDVIDISGGQFPLRLGVGLATQGDGPIFGVDLRGDRAHVPMEQEYGLHSRHEPGIRVLLHAVATLSQPIVHTLDSRYPGGGILSQSHIGFLGNRSGQGDDDALRADLNRIFLEVRFEHIGLLHG